MKPEIDEALDRIAGGFYSTENYVKKIGYINQIRLEIIRLESELEIERAARDALAELKRYEEAGERSPLECLLKSVYRMDAKGDVRCYRVPIIEGEGENEIKS